MNPDLKVAIVHDWLIGGGAERVVYELHQMFPDAPIYTSYCTDEWRGRLEGKVVTGFLQRWPFSKLRKFLPPLRAMWFSRLNLQKYDLIISSSGAEAKFVKAPAGAKHIAYIHAPTHYYWSRYDEYMTNPGFPTGLNWLAKLGLRVLVAPLRTGDFAAAQRPDLLIANSTYTQQAIKKYYGRESTVVHPPIDTKRFELAANSSPLKTRSGFVIAGRQTPYKRVDLAVAACTALGVNLTVIGNGPDHGKLRRMAGPTVTFITGATDAQVAACFVSAQAFIFPGTDDFGITPVEALAAGTPVIAYKDGGALDYVIPGQTGAFFTQPTAQNLASSLNNFKPGQYNAAHLKAFAQNFSVETFHTKLSQEIQRCLGRR